MNLNQNTISASNLIQNYKCFSSVAHTIVELDIFRQNIKLMLKVSAGKNEHIRSTQFRTIICSWIIILYIIKYYLGNVYLECYLRDSYFYEVFIRLNIIELECTKLPVHV